MPTVSSSATVSGSAEDIFDFLADYRNIPRLQPHFSSATLVGDKDRQEGAVVALEGRFHGVPMHVRNRIIAYLRPSRLTSVSEGTVLSRNTWELQQIDHDPPVARVTLTVDYKVRGALGLVVGLGQSIFNQEIQAMTDDSLRRLHGFFEKEPAS